LTNDKRFLPLNAQPPYLKGIQPYQRLGSKSGEVCIFNDEILYFAETEPVEGFDA
jgi:hypothetical protein